jgi:hypothetical protein
LCWEEEERDFGLHVFVDASIHLRDSSRIFLWEWISKQNVILIHEAMMQREGDSESKWMTWSGKSAI